MCDRLPRRPFRRVLLVGLLSGLLALAASWHQLAAADEIEDLRGHIPTGEALRDELAEIANRRSELLTDRNGAERELIEVFAARDSFSARQRALAIEIEEETKNLRFLAVQAFVAGGPISNLNYLLSVADVSDVSWRQHLVRNHAGASEVAISHLAQLEAEATDDVKQSIEDASVLRREIALFEIDLAALDPRALEIDDLLPLADAWDRAVIAIEEGSFGIAPPEKWEALRFCESTHDYAAVSPSGQYRGAYQFDFETWETVGGHGDPAVASSEEQDARARELYARRGHQPWPKCGSHLQ